MSDGVQVLRRVIYRINVYDLEIMDMSTFCTKEKKCVHYTSVCSMISIDMCMLTARVLLLSGKHMQIAVRVYLYVCVVLINYYHGGKPFLKLITKNYKQIHVVKLNSSRKKIETLNERILQVCSLLMSFTRLMLSFTGQHV